MPHRADNPPKFDAALEAAWSALGPVPRKDFCARAGISERTFDRRQNITKLRRGRRVFSTELDLKRELARRAGEERTTYLSRPMPTRGEAFGLLLSMSAPERDLFSARLAVHLGEHPDLAGAIRETAADIQAAREAAL